MERFQQVWRCFENERSSSAVYAWYQRWWAVCALLLFGSTWRLWSPQSVFPQVPLVRAAGELPGGLEWVAFGLILASLAVALAAVGESRLRRPALFTFVTATVLLAVLDQHRLQPWAYQFVIVAVVLACRGPARGLALLRLLVVSIYFYSALGKFDYQFLNTVGQQFLAEASRWIGFDFDGLSGQSRAALALVFPAGELTVAGLLCVPRLARVGVVAALLLHGALLLLLGPTGLHHEPGVLIWNVFFAGQALVLFGWPIPRADENSAPDNSAADNSVEEGAKPSPDRPRGGGRPGLVELLMAVVVVAPLLEPFGLWDHWLSWGLYSPRNSRVAVQVATSAWDRLPPAVQRASERRSGSEGWVTIDLGRWSLETLSAPIYPQARFQLGVAIGLADQVGLEREVRVQLQGMSQRLTGQRTIVTLEGRPQMQAATTRYRWNARPNGRLE